MEWKLMWKISKVMRISRLRSPIQNIRDQKQLENVEYLNCLSSIITNDATCSREINPGLPWQEQRWTRRRLLSQVNLGLNLRNKIAKWCIWGISLCDAETWTLREVDQKYLESFEMWCWNSIEKIFWVHRVRKEVQAQVYRGPTPHPQKKLKIKEINFS